MKHVLLESITETEADGYYFGQFKSMDPITLMGTLDDPICLIHRMELERARNEGRFKEVYELVEYQDKAEQRFGSPDRGVSLSHPDSAPSLSGGLLRRIDQTRSESRD